MDDQEIWQKLNILEFDATKHKSLKAALKELLDGKYQQVMNGEILDADRLAEVRVVIEAYDKLKDYEEYILDKMITGSKVETISETFLVDNKRIIQRKEDSEDYETILEFNKEDTVRVFDEYVAVINKNNSIDIYNLNGKVIHHIPGTEVPLPNIMVKKITDNLIHIYLLANISHSYHHSLINPRTNEELPNCNSILQSTYSKIFYSQDISKEKKDNFFNLCCKGKTPEYLKRVLNGESSDILLWNHYISIQMKKTGEIIFYTLEGKKIISSDEDNYSYIERYGNSQANIIVIGRKDFNNNLEERYGYYDLDKRMELVSPKFLKAYSFRHSFAIAFDKTIHLIDKNGDISTYGSILKDGKLGNAASLFITDLEEEQERFKPILVKNIYYALTYPDLFKENGIYSEKEKKKMIGYKDCEYNPEYYEYKDSEFKVNVIRDAKRMNANTYLVSYCQLMKYAGSIEIFGLDEFACLYDDETNQKQALVKNLFSSPKKVSKLYDYIEDCFHKRDDVICNCGFGLHGLTLQGDEYDLIGSNMQAKALEDKSYELPKIGFIGERYLLPEYQNKKIRNELTQILGSDYQLPIKQKKEELMNREKQELSTQLLFSPPVDSKKPFIFDGTLERLKNISKDDTMLMQFSKGSYMKSKDILVNSKGNVIFMEKECNASVKFLDELGNICLTAPYNKSKRDILVDSNGNVVIFFSNNIREPENDTYIVTRDSKNYLFDRYGNQLMIPHDYIEWTNKYYVDSSGIVRNKEPRLMVTDGGYQRIIDNDQEISIEKSTEYEETMKKLVLLRKELKNVDI